MTSINFDEELYEQVLDTLPMFKEREKEGIYISVSSLQRRFRRGYSDCTSIMKKLEQDGYITVFDGINSPRVLKTR